MTWRKLGRIFDPKDHNLKSHAQVPTPHVSKDLLIYFSSRDNNGKSHTYMASFDRENPTELIHFNQSPVLTLGKPGTFDDDGVMPGTIINNEGEIWMFYSGWNQRITVPYHNATGLAKSQNGTDFIRAYTGPILDRTATEPYLAVTPSIILEGTKWRMWYISGIDWLPIDNRYEPLYVIKYAHSTDGINWIRERPICIPQNHSEEAFSHPTVIKEGSLYKMWYCYRGSRDYRNGENSYKIGHATSEDGITWVRRDKIDIIQASSEGWDSKMICYPNVFKIKDKTYMLYNGNGFGENGFGIAVWEESND